MNRKLGKGLRKLRRTKPARHRQSREEESIHRKQKKLERALQSLEGKVLVVEGKNDLGSLRKAGVSQEIVLMNQSAGKVADRVKRIGSEAVVLTDFDRRGEERLLQMKEALEAVGVGADCETRKAFREALGVKFFEDFHRKLEEFRQRSER